MNALTNWWMVHQNQVIGMLGLFLALYLMGFGFSVMFGAPGRAVFRAFNRAIGRALRGIWRFCWFTAGDVIAGVFRFIGGIFGGGGGQGGGGNRRRR